MIILYDAGKNNRRFRSILRRLRRLMTLGVVLTCRKGLAAFLPAAEMYRCGTDSALPFGAFYFSPCAHTPEGTRCIFAFGKNVRLRRRGRRRPTVHRTVGTYLSSPFFPAHQKAVHSFAVYRFLVRRKGLEPPTFWFVARHSIQLSYRRMCTIAPRYHSTAAGKMQAFFQMFPVFGKSTLKCRRKWRRIEEAKHKTKEAAS